MRGESKEALMAVAEPQHQNRQAHDATPSRIKVLLIEDDPNDARLIQYLLADAGAGLFQVEHVDRLAPALERVTNDHVDVVLADLTLPDSRDLEALEQLLARTPHVPIIVLSGLNDTTIAIKAVHEGAQDFLVKGQVSGPLLARAIQYAIERKRMDGQLHRYAEELRAKNAQLEADFNVAREIQQTFLPHEYPTFPHWAPPEQSALKFSHRYISAAAVGGDFFDLFAINDSIAGIFICDVMGHGMRAALITAIMRGLVEELLPLAAEPGKFMMEINRSLRAILRQTREAFLATAFYGVVDVAHSELRFANGGHPSPFRIWREGRTVEPLKNYDAGHGPALGLFEKAIYPTGRCPLATKDLLFLYTDGIYEVTDKQGNELGQERLLAAVRQRVELPAEQLFDELLAAARGFSGGKEFDDDVCLVGVEIRQLGG
jgi:serine phosphatase RsbU (regulator of sigma subunit)